MDKGDDDLISGFFVGLISAVILVALIGFLFVGPSIGSHSFQRGHCWGSCSAQGFTRGEWDDSKQQCVCIEERKQVNE